MPTEHETKIADLEKRNAQLERIAKLNGAHKARYDVLPADDAAAFLAKSTAERDAECAAQAADIAKRNEVEFVAGDGTIYRKSDDPKMVSLAKQLDAARSESASQAIEKRADETLTGFAKAARTPLLRAVEGIADEAVRKTAIEALKAASHAITEATKSRGYTADDPSTAGPMAAYNTALAAFAKSVGKPIPQATSEFMRTAEGAALYEAAAPLPARN